MVGRDDVKIQLSFWRALVELPADSGFNKRKLLQLVEDAV